MPVPFSRVRLAAALAAGTAAGLLATGLVAAPASADDGSIDHVETRPGSTQVLYSMPGTDASADLGDVRVTFDGEPVTARAALASGSDSGVRRTTVLAIDVSDSMRVGGRFADARAAADVFLAAVPEDVYVGIVTFAGSVTVAQRPTLDREASRRVIQGLRLSRGTYLYDAVARSAALLGTNGQRSILVLSDGRDTSRTPLADVTAQLQRTGVKVDVVALAQDARERALIAPLSDAGEGTVISASTAAELRQAFADEAGVLDDQLVITVEPPAGEGPVEGTLAVELSAGGTAYTDTAFVTLARATAKKAAVDPTAALPMVEPSRFAMSPNALLAGLAGIGLALVIVMLALLGGIGRRETSLEDRISAYTRQGAGQRAPAPTPQGARAQAVGVAARALAGNRNFEQRLNDRLEAAGMSLRAAEWLLLHGGIVVVGTSVVFLVSGGNVLLGVVALVATVAVPWVYLGQRKSKRLKAFNSQLPATLQLLAGSLQAGLSLAQGMDTIVREGADPVAGEFRRALVETRLGVNVEDALDSVSDRMDSDDFRWTVMAIRIQREVGGNLAELMLNVATTMRDREYLRRQIKSLSAEGRFSAYILLALPPVVMLFLAITNGAYLRPLLVTPMGWVLLAGMTLLMGLGAFIMNRMIKVEV